MLIPVSLYGIYKEIKPTFLKALTKVKKGMSILDALEGDKLLDTNKVPGFIVLHGPSSLLGSTPNFHVYSPAALLAHFKPNDYLRPEQYEKFFLDCLTTPWSTLMLLGPCLFFWMDTDERKKKFLLAVANHWEIYINEGKRYALGVDDGSSIEKGPNMIYYCLSNLYPEFGIKTANDYSTSDFIALLRKYGS